MSFSYIKGNDLLKDINLKIDSLNLNYLLSLWKLKNNNQNKNQDLKAFQL